MRRTEEPPRPLAAGLKLSEDHLDAIEQSHERCVALGVSRIERPDHSPLGRPDLAVARERNLRLHDQAAPVMEMLYEQIVRSDSMVVLTDATGTIIHSVGDDDFLERASKVALKPGAVWSETAKGTNAIGTALVEETPTLVHADEHYVHANHFLTCSAAPILDPRGNILGVLDVSGDHRSYHQHTMALVKMSARMIENRWLTDDYRNVLRLHFHGRVEFIGTLMEGILAVAADGKIVVTPGGPRGQRIPMLDVVESARSEGLYTPVLLRFQDILRHRVKKLNTAFEAAIDDNKYRGKYRGVFPIKVNQLREVVEEILDAGRSSHFGIEVGSKPEMFAALSIHSDNESLIVCNGYKDDGFIRTALIGRKLGKKVILIAEKLSEVRNIVRIAKEMQVEPMIGLRCRLVSKGAGKWATSAGEHAKFGLTTSEILQAIDILKEANLASAFKLLHFHIGSQVPDIQIIKRAVREAARHYAKLRKMGQQVEYIDVGGGLAIDYDGSHSTFHSSMNYSLEEYARDIVYNVADICDEEKVPHPDLISESGRAMVAHHSVLIVEAFGSIEKQPMSSANIDASTEHKLVQEIAYIEEQLRPDSLSECWNDLVPSMSIRRWN